MARPRRRRPADAVHRQRFHRRRRLHRPGGGDAAGARLTRGFMAQWRWFANVRGVGVVYSKGSVLGTMTDRIARYHEDDEGQIQVLPTANWDDCTRQIEAIDGFSEQHRDPNGAGWTDVYIRDTEMVPLARLGLGIANVSGCLSNDLPTFDSVEIDFGGWRQCKGTQAYGFDGCVVFVSTTESGIVDQIWLELHGPAEFEQTSLLAALQKLSGLGPLLLVDWDWSRLFALTDQEGMSLYLKEREL